MISRPWGGAVHATGGSPPQTVVPGPRNAAVPLRIGIVGAGHMGRRHAAKVAELAAAGAGVTLAGVADIDLERARDVAGPLSAPGLRDVGQLYRRADAAVVAVPVRAHHSVVAEALDAGLDVLVEKPMAATLEEAQDLLALGERHGRVLRVGHLESFNTATRALGARMRKPRFIEVQRVGPFPSRGTDVDVVRDLMIHDIGVLQLLLGEEPEDVAAAGLRVASDWIDVATARLRFRSGCVAALTASRVSERPLRRMRVFEPDACLSVDFLEGPEDALLAQLEAFVTAVRCRERPGPAAVGALGALRTALRVIDAMRPRHHTGWSR